MSRSGPKLPKLKASRDEVRRLYLDKGLSLREIAEKTGVTYQNVHHHLKALGVERRGRGSTKKRPPRFERKLLNDLYVKKGMSMDAIGRVLGVSGSAIKRELEAYGIKTQRRVQRTPETVALQKKAVKLYEKGWGVYRIAERFGKHPQSIYSELARAGIELRYNKALLRTFDDLKRLYVTEKMSIRGICKMLGITPDRLKNELIKQNIPLRDHKNPIRYPELASLKIGESAVFPRTKKRNYHKPFLDDARRIGIRITIQTIDQESVRVVRL